MADQLKKKMLYVMENVAENGYDTSKFNKFYADKHGKNLNMDALSFEEVIDCVREFKQAKSQSKPINV